VTPPVIFLIKGLTESHICRILGNPGDGINGVIGAIQRAGNAIHHVQVRHEPMAAFMACIHDKFTGEVGVCLATPGAVHLLNGLYDTKMDHAPAVALGGHYPPNLAAQSRSRRAWDEMKGDRLVLAGLF
jgi:pyruvate dehydrogenase (quinone)